MADGRIASLATTAGVLRRQLVVAAAVAAAFAAVAVIRPGEAREVALAAATVVVLWLAGALVVARTCLRDRTRDAIADGASADDPLVGLEMCALSTPGFRVKLARSLLRALADGHDWSRLAVASRPPPGIRNLVACELLVDDVVRLVCDPCSSVRGVAMLERLLRGGSAGVLYAGSPAELERELGRIRFMLAGTASRPSSSPNAAWRSVA
jgi:hypothetical protein